MTSIAEHDVATDRLARRSRSFLTWFGWEGISLSVAGAALLARALFDYSAGDPPALGPELLTWISNNKPALSMSDELLVIASVLLIPGLVGLYQSLRSTNPRAAAAGCGILVAAIPVMMMMSILGGRLVFPVYDMQLTSPDSAQLTTALYYGGDHAIMIIVGVATIVISLAMKGTHYGAGFLYLGLITALADFAAAYPWLIGLQATLAAKALFALWFLATGIKLSRHDLTKSTVPGPDPDVAERHLVPPSTDIHPQRTA